jgi:hypothetical protein
LDTLWLKVVHICVALRLQHKHEISDLKTVSNNPMQTWCTALLESTGSTENSVILTPCILLWKCCMPSWTEKHCASNQHKLDMHKTKLCIWQMDQMVKTLRLKSSCEPRRICCLSISALDLAPRRLSLMCLENS